MKNIFCFLIPIFLLISCENKNDYDLSTDTNYIKGKINLEKAEKENPPAFLSINGVRKKNILGQSIIKGQIINRAKIVAYKDVDVKFFFYSKTGALLEEDHEVLYETIAPGGKKKFKSKYFTPKDTDSVAFKIIGAKF